MYGMRDLFRMPSHERTEVRPPETFQKCRLSLSHSGHECPPPASHFKNAEDDGGRRRVRHLDCLSAINQTKPNQSINLCAHRDRPVDPELARPNSEERLAGEICSAECYCTYLEESIIVTSSKPLICWTARAGTKGFAGRRRGWLHALSKFDLQIQLVSCFPCLDASGS